MAILDELLSRGYFPKELPPCFRTTEFAELIIPNELGIPASFEKAPDARLCSYSFARSGGIRRRLSVAHPVHQFNLCKCIAAHWEELTACMGRSTLSLSTAVPDAGGDRAVTPKVSLTDLLRYKAERRAAAKYILQTDISNFYDSIYTHSIPWAIHGKAEAKQDKTDRYFGNTLDRLLRKLQYGQTIGIPTGPDTSLIVAELIVSAADEQLVRRHADLQGFRHMDDFELSFYESGIARQVLADLQSVLLEYELRLSPTKTLIREAPVPFEFPWYYDIEDFDFRTGADFQQSDLIRFFDLVAGHMRLFPRENVMKYALVKLAGVEVNPDNWALYLSLLCQAVVIEPAGIQQFVGTLKTCSDAGHAPDADLLQTTLNRLIREHAPLGHDHEVSWAIWGAIEFGLEIDRNSAAAVSEMESSVVALLALDAEERGLVPPGLRKDRWEGRMEAEELHKEQWLLAYEANVRGWLPSKSGGDHVNEDESFAYLKALGVRFYEPAAVTVGVEAGAWY